MNAQTEKQDTNSSHSPHSGTQRPALFLPTGSQAQRVEGCSRPDKHLFSEFRNGIYAVN